MQLYLVTSEEYSSRNTMDVVGEAIRNGVEMVQMREKNKNRMECLRLGRAIKGLCSGSGTKFIVNDDPELAREVDADGVHMGQEDIARYPVADIRGLLGEKILGLSTHSLEDVRAANACDLDYVGYGPVFPTQTKDYSVGIEEIESVLAVSRFPVFFIGGINIPNIRILKDMGAENFAVITAITRAEDIARAIENLREA